jgi:hypothetical protein
MIGSALISIIALLMLAETLKSGASAAAPAGDARALS